MALAFGISCLPSLASAQYAAPYGNGALAPSGYAMNPAYSGNQAYGGNPAYASQPMAYSNVPMMPQNGIGHGVAQMPQMQPMQPVQQYAQPGMPSMHTVAYPQESILAPNPVPAPSVNAQQPVERGWVGPTNGSYHAAPVPDPAPMQSAPMHSAPMHSAPMQSAPMQGSATPVYADQSYGSGGCASGCGGGYNGGPAYGTMLAPAASAPVYGGGCGRFMRNQFTLPPLCHWVTLADSCEVMELFRAKPSLLAAALC